MAAVLFFAAAAAAIVSLLGSHSGAKRPAAESGRVAAARRAAVTWVTAQVGHQAVVACDPVFCAALAARGFPTGDLATIEPSTTDLRGAGVLVATAAVRGQFGASLAGTYAPEILASFGQGTGRIEIRLLATGGAAAFRNALAADLAERKAYGSSLLRNKRIVAASSVQQSLAAGEVDARLLDTFAFLASQQPIRVVAFGGEPPGASPGVPLRVAYLSESDTASHMSGLAYEQALSGLLNAQRSPFKPTVTFAHLSDGLGLIKVSFTAPSPLGLLNH